MIFRVCCRGDFGRLGHGHGSDITLPQQISSLKGMPVASVSCGDAHTLVVLQDGRLMGFGRNQNGQIGNGTTADCFECTEVQNLQHERVFGSSCGAEHSICVTESGSVYAWCDHRSARALLRALAIVLNRRHMCRGWGRYGNLGTGSDNDECVSVLTVAR